MFPDNAQICSDLNRTLRSINSYCLLITTVSIGKRTEKCSYQFNVALSKIISPLVNLISNNREMWLGVVVNELMFKKMHAVVLTMIYKKDQSFVVGQLKVRE